MNTKQIKEYSYYKFECKPKRNSVLSLSNYMALSLYSTQKWIVDYTYRHIDGRDFRLTRKNLTLFLTESEFNENFEFR